WDPLAARTRGGGRGHAVPRNPSLAHEAEELHALAESSAHDRGVAEHPPHHRHDLPRPEVEAAVEGLHRVEDLRLAETRVVEGGDLHAVGVHQVPRLDLEP